MLVLRGRFNSRDGADHRNVMLIFPGLVGVSFPQRRVLPLLTWTNELPQRTYVTVTPQYFIDDGHRVASDRMARC